MFDIVPRHMQPRAEERKDFAIRIVSPTIFRGVAVDVGAEFHDINGTEFATMLDCGRAVRIAKAAQIERAEVAPVVEVPEHRVAARRPSAADAEASTPRKRARKERS
jgi:hypothetical protein